MVPLGEFLTRSIVVTKRKDPTNSQWLSQYQTLSEHRDLGAMRGFSVALMGG